MFDSNQNFTHGESISEFTNDFILREILNFSPYLILFYLSTVIDTIDPSLLETLSSLGFHVPAGPHLSSSLFSHSFSISSTDSSVLPSSNIRPPQGPVLIFLLLCLHCSLGTAQPLIALTTTSVLIDHSTTKFSFFIQIRFTFLFREFLLGYLVSSHISIIHFLKYIFTNIGKIK